ncbi:type I methionyl aminopeptidase [Alphaproteobacteria bacterium]|nr:type I methionyl aminopeptidase [Alphaproteobacteria bacterium]
MTQPQRHTEDNIPLFDAAAFEKMRAAGKLAAQVLDFIAPHIAPGVSTETLNTLCHDYIIKHKAIPAPLNYHGFPKSICTSVNHVVCHGIPAETKVLHTGDILNIDVTVILDGWYGDTSRMYTAGAPSVQAQKLMDVTYDALMGAIDMVRPGVKFGDIGHFIQNLVESKGFSTVREFCGHGIGNFFHGPPEVLHFGAPNTGITLEEGMFFTIEPMINAGRAPTKVLKDGWTAVTKDKSLSAQYEHTMGVTKDGVEIFTQVDKAND